MGVGGQCRICQLRCSEVRKDPAATPRQRTCGWRSFAVHRWTGRRVTHDAILHKVLRVQVFPHFGLHVANASLVASSSRPADLSSSITQDRTTASGRGMLSCFSTVSFNSRYASHFRFRDSVSTDVIVSSRKALVSNAEWASNTSIVAFARSRMRSSNSACCTHLASPVPGEPAL